MFASSSDEVGPLGKSLLDKAASIARQGYSVKVTAKTDGSGPYQFNQKLAQRRADAVVKILAASAIGVPGKVEVILEPCCINGRLPADSGRRVVDVVVRKERA